MQFPIILAFALIGSTVVEAAPTAGLDAATLLQNGQEALKLNNEFKTLQLTDSCSAGQVACIQNAIAQCVGGTWSTSSGQCAQTQQCFAVPSVREAGVNVVCTSEASALSIIAATGATNNPNNGGAGSPTSTNPSKGGSPSGGTGTGIVFVTVTVTANPSPSTLPPLTQTLSPAEASQALSSLIAAGGSTIAPSGSGTPCTTNPTSLPTVSLPAAPSEITPAATPSGTPSTVILLTAATISPATSAAAASYPVPTSTAPGASGGGYGGY